MSNSAKAVIFRWSIVVVLAVAFGYIEAAVVVYLREIFHPQGFAFPLISFPLTAESNRLLLVEIGREAATIVLILACCLLAGRNLRQQLAYFMTIFAVWDIFYYVWLKVLLGWPVSIMDWDILFLIPLPWASPVLAPVLVSIAMLLFAATILYRDHIGRPVKVSFWDMSGFGLAGLVIIASFCFAGKYMTQSDYAGHFSWPFFGVGFLCAVASFGNVFIKKPPF